MLLVDEHPILRVPLAALISAEPDFKVCGQACSRKEALTAVKAKLPDLALVGLRLRDSNGLDLIKDLNKQCPEVAVIVVSMFEGGSWVERSLRAGARGFVSKRQHPAELLKAMRQVLAGEYYINGTMVRRLSKTLPGVNSSTDRMDELPDREYQVLWYLGHGYAMKEIAEHLRVSVPTVETYCSRLKARLGCDKQTDLIKSAIQWAHCNPVL